MKALLGDSGTAVKSTMFGGDSKDEHQQQQKVGPKLSEPSHSGHGRVEELSQIAKVVVDKCARILSVKPKELKNRFEEEAPDFAKEPSLFARSFLEYCCILALPVATQAFEHLSDKEFRSLTFDMMVAWETPAATNQPSPKDYQSMEALEEDESSEDSALFYSDLMPLLVDVESTVGRESFVRLAPLVPQIADIINAHSQFEELTSATAGRLPFPVYDKYVEEVDRAIKTMKRLKFPALVTGLNLEKEEITIEVDGTIATQPVLQHIGVSTCPGRLTLTDYALYFEAAGIVSYEKPMKFDLSADLGHSVKPDLTGPWGARLFDKAITYKSTLDSEPVVFEFPELTGHTRRDYWLAILREIIFVHQFIRKYNLAGFSRTEALSKAVLGIARLKATRDAFSMLPPKPERLLAFSSAEQLPGGDLVLEALAEKLNKNEPAEPNASNKLNEHKDNHLYSTTATAALYYSETPQLDNKGIPMSADMTIGELTPLEKIVLQSRNDARRVELAQATIDGVKLDGIGKNLRVLKELITPLFTFLNWLQSIANWEQPVKTVLFCLMFSFIIYRNWIGILIPLVLLISAGWIIWNQYKHKENQDYEVLIPPSPPQSTVEQLLQLQQGLSQVEELIQKANISLLKFRALMLSALPEATNKLLLFLVGLSIGLAVLPLRVIALIVFWEVLSNKLQMRRDSSERFNRRLREWWYSIPVLPVRFVDSNEAK